MSFVIGVKTPYDYRRWLVYNLSAGLAVQPCLLINMVLAWYVLVEVGSVGVLT